MTRTAQRVLRYAGYGLLALPASVSGVLRAWAERRLLAREPLARRAGAAAHALHVLLSVTLGLLAWFLAFLIGLAAVRGIFYPLIADGNLEGSWGGPSPGGAWAVHAALGVLVAPPIGVGIIAALGMLQSRLARQGAWWPVPVAGVVTVAGALLFLSWLHQV
ncbi:hypothetical protein [Nocardia sp. NPDC051570]|uniref:hypothetical protein n=1 Tax=Nocardia sp. NPDC051570 TaxID=3364324 RepID=UPI00378CFC68